MFAQNVLLRDIWYAGMCYEVELHNLIPQLKEMHLFLLSVVAEKGSETFLFMDTRYFSMLLDFSMARLTQAYASYDRDNILWGTNLCI